MAPLIDRLIPSRAQALNAVRAARRRLETISKDKGEANTYGLPNGNDLTVALRRWLKRQLRWLLGNVPTIGAPLPAGALDVTDWTDPMARAFTPLLSAYWKQGYDGKVGELGARTGLDLDEFAVVSETLAPSIARQAFDFCNSTNATTTQTLAEAHQALREALHAELVTKDEAEVGLVDRIQAIYQGMSESKARQIGMTESSRALHTAQEVAAINSGVVAGKEILISADACDLCQKIAAECRRVPLGGTFAVVGDHPTYSHIECPPLHPSCRCTMVDVLSSEYGGPIDPAWGETLIQPQEDIPDTGYVPPRGVRVPRPEPERMEPPKPPTVAELTPTVFVNFALAAAREVGPEGRFGPDKVFIHRAYEKLVADLSKPRMSLAEFKQWLLEANRLRLIDLSRADLIEAMDRADVEASNTSIGKPGAPVYNFIRLQELNPWATS